MYTPMENTTPEAEFVLQFINQTNRSVFLTGKAGTGKTTLLKKIIATTHKNTVVVAPTGIAALNAGGVTIHSMFQLPFGGFLPVHEAGAHFSDNLKFETRDTLYRHFKMNGLKKAVIQNMELLIIDEVSMLRADLLDAIDYMLQSVRKNSQPFGGVQVLFIGDLLQLPPVVRDEEWRILRAYYAGKFFFHSHVIRRHPPLYIELPKIFRQKDDRFIALLNNLRNNYITEQDIATLNQFVRPGFDFKANKGYITLTTHNAKADRINAASLADLKGAPIDFYTEITGDFPEKIYPVEEKLTLKQGAQVMFIKNDPSPEKNYFNGKMGIVKSLSEAEIIVHFPEEGKTIEVEKYEWQHIRYVLNPDTREVEEEVLGTFVQYPLRLAWAITVHKSQGLTFDKAALDVSQVFLPGQAYVALSRLRSLDGLVLLSPLRMNGMANDQDVMQYAESKSAGSDLPDTLKNETKRFIFNYLISSFDWRDLSREWRAHRDSYRAGKPVSAKSTQAGWAKKQSESIEGLLGPSQKFLAQLHSVFAKEVDFQFVADRIEAAYQYFFPLLDQLTDELFTRLVAAGRAKKAKTLYEELMALEALQTSAIIRLMKARLLMAAVVRGEPLSKDKLNTAEIKNYRTEKLSKIRENLNIQNGGIPDHEEDTDRYARKKKAGEPKKSTVMETYQLWQQRYSIREIANMRKLTPQTICNHMAKLIESETLRISEVLPEEKIRELSEIFKGFKGDTLGELKEKHGDRFTWDELKMFKASL